MKQILILVVFIFTIQVTIGQKLTVKKLKQIELNSHKKIVTQALTYNDALTAINSMHHIIVLEGINSTYKDSLAITYFNARNYVSSYLLAKELLVSKPNSLQLLEISAVSLQSLNQTKEAITAYEKLFAQANNMAHGYQLANLQFGIKRMSEAQETIIRTLQCKEIEGAFAQFPVDKTKNQNVPLKAGAYHLLGLISYELKDNATANEAFNEALKIEPKFALATQNLNALTASMQNNNKEAKKQ